MMKRASMAWVPVVFGMLVGTASCGEGEVLKEPDGGLLKPAGLDRRAKLVIEAPEVRSAMFGEKVLIRSRLLYADDAVPVAGAVIKYEIVGEALGSELAQLTVTTAADGRAETVLLTGERRGQINVRVSTRQFGDGALSEELTLDIDGVYKGNLRVKFEYDDVVPLEALDVRLHQGYAACDAVEFMDLPEGEYTKQALHENDVALFQFLEEKQRYTVTVVANGPAGNAVAVGCVNAPAIMGRTTVEVTVPLSMRAPNLKGTYDIRNAMQLHQLVPGIGAEIIEYLDALANDPADFIANFFYEDPTMYEALASVIPILGILDGDKTHMVVDTALRLAGYEDLDGDGKVLDDVLRTEVVGKLPSEGLDAFRVAGDITQLLTNLTVGGEFEVLDFTPDGVVTGRWGWNDFLWRWRLGLDCAIEDECCGRQVFSGEEFDLEPVSSDFTGFAERKTDVQGLVYHLQIDAHEVSLQYGNVLNYVMRHVVLKSLTGQHGLRAALETWIGTHEVDGVSYAGCELVAQQLAKLLQAVPVPTLQFACEEGLDAVDTLISDQLMQLVLSNVADNYAFRVQIDAEMQDEDFDLQIDTLKGKTSGTFGTTQESVGFDGQLMGDLQRTACATNATCLAGQSCQLRAAVMDQCEGRTVCLADKGDQEAGTACWNGNQCRTGLCLDNDTCFGACSVNTDCGEAQQCSGPIEYELDDLVTMSLNVCQ